jgi:cytoskeletal protein CcmA (bactofilin family)
MLRGALSSNCPIDVKGNVEGEVTAPSLTVSAGGSVHGKVKVGAIHSHGELGGEFDADVVQLAGTVQDNTVIRAKSIEVRLTPEYGKMEIIFSTCGRDIGEQATKETTEESAVSPMMTSVRSNGPEERASESAIEPPLRVGPSDDENWESAPPPANATR